MSDQDHPDVYLGLHLYSDDHDRIIGAVEPALGLVETPHEAAWVVRYRDTIGAHVRLRLRVPPSRVRPALDTLKDIERDAVRPGGCAQSATFMPYQPELWKYRSMDEIVAASQVWTTSTELAVAGAEASDIPDRLALLLTTLRATIDLLTPAEADQFLTHYKQYWSTGHGGPGLPDAARTLGQIPDGCEQIIKQYVTDLDDYLACDIDDRRSRGFLLFHQVHLTNNRLGTSPELEVAVAQMIDQT